MRRAAPARARQTSGVVGRGLWLLAITVLAWIGLMSVTVGGMLMSEVSFAKTFSEDLRLAAYRQWRLHAVSVVARGLPIDLTPKVASSGAWPAPLLLDAKKRFSALWEPLLRTLPAPIGIRPAKQISYEPLSSTWSVAWPLAQVVWFRWLRLGCASPVVLLLTVVALSDGLVQRSLRRLHGARESALLFHQLKRGWFALWGMGLFLYLANPLPWISEGLLWLSVVLLMMVAAITLAQFKKYL